MTIRYAYRLQMAVGVECIGCPWSRNGLQNWKFCTAIFMLTQPTQVHVKTTKLYGHIHMNLVIPTVVIKQQVYFRVW